MRKFTAIVLILTILATLAGCGRGEPEAPAVVRSFLAGYEDEAAGQSSRILLNLLSDGTAEFYVGKLEGEEHTMLRYSGTYTLGENAEFDETISLNYTNEVGTTILISDAVIVDSIFEMEFTIPGSEAPASIKFYESAPADMEGDVYVGYLTKVGGMGPMVYCYALSLKDGGNFHVSIMQMASVMHVFGETTGTYAVDGENITFTYDIRTDEGEIVSENEIVEGTGFNGTLLTTAFNIQQATMRASDAPFIKVK